MGIDRRTFLKGLGTGIAGVASGSLLMPSGLEAGEMAANREFMGVLVDTAMGSGQPL